MKETNFHVNTWIPIKDVVWNDSTILQHHIDTRDFHVSCLSETSTEFKSFTRLEKHPEEYIFNEEEVKLLIENLFEKSGGNIEWRFLSIDEDHCRNWDLKYIRIFRYMNGLVVCNNNFYTLKRKILDPNKIIQKYL